MGILAAAATVLLGGGVAVAASLTATSSSVGAVNTSVSRCSTAGIGVAETLSGSSIVGVTVSSIDAACQGGTMTVTVNTGSATAAGTATVSAPGPMSVTVSPSLSFVTGAEVDVVVAGP